VLTQLQAAWFFETRFETSEAEFSLEFLGEFSLESLGDEFNQNLVGVTLPSSLLGLTFGDYFDQSRRDDLSAQPAEFDG